LRRLIEGKEQQASLKPQQAPASASRYRVKQDFDPVELLNFRDESFKIVLDYFKAAIEKINGVDQLKSRFVSE